MQAKVYDKFCRHVATVSKLPMNMQDALKELHYAVQEALVDSRGFDGIQNCEQFVHSTYELDKIIIGSRWMIRVEKLYSAVNSARPGKFLKIVPKEPTRENPVHS